MRLVPITNRRGEVVAHAKVDADLRFMLASVPWHLGKSGYAMTGFRKNGTCVTLYMHRVVNATPAGMQTDHINGDPLDNRRCNLRTCTDRENKRNQKRRSDNKSGYKGVSWDKKSMAWTARISDGEHCLALGHFGSAEQAALAYRAAASRIFGQFANMGTT